MNKRDKRCLGRALAVILMGTVLCGCEANNTGNSSSNTVEQDKVEIGMCFDSFVIERWQRDRDIFVSAAKELGADRVLKTDTPNEIFALTIKELSGV